MGSRRKGRVIAFQALFAWDAHDGSDSEILSFLWLDEERRQQIDDDVLAFASLIVSGTIENITEIDGQIRENAEHWDLSRIARVDLAILRMSVFSILYQPEMPPSVVINEAVEIAKRFGGENSYRFVNGVLDGIRKRRKSE